MSCGLPTVFFDTAENVVHVIRKETAGVEHCLNQPGNRPQRHVFCVGMSVPLGTTVEESAVGKPSEEWGHLQSLFDLLHEHVAIRRKAVHGQHRTIRSDGKSGSTDGVILIGERDRVQSEYFGCISRLDAVALALPRIPCDNTEIGSSDSQNCSAILCVRVELPLIRILDVCDHGWHLNTVRCSRESSRKGRGEER